MNPKEEGSAASYITDSGYLKFRLELKSEAMSDPIMQKRLEDGELSFEKYSGLISAEIEPKLRAYREKHGLDENGAKKK